MVPVNRLLIVAVVSLTLLLGCDVDSTLHLAGNVNSIGAEVYIDSVYIDSMKKINNGAHLTVRIKPGTHHLKVKSKDGRKFNKNFSIKGENYIGVHFADEDSANLNSNKN